MTDMSEDRHIMKETEVSKQNEARSASSYPKLLLDEEYIKWPEHAKSEIELGILQMQILWLLSRHPTHGYELMKTLTVLKGTNITQGTLYPTLKRLEELDLIKGIEKDRRIVYNITSKGKKVMNDTCLEFVKTFYGIFHDFACESCTFYEEHHKGGKK